MNRCLDADTLVSLGTALDWDTEETLRHVVECTGCFEQLQRLATVHRALTEEMQPAAGFSERVMSAIPVSEPGPDGRRHHINLLDALNPVLASMTVFFAIAATSAGDPQMLLGLPAVFISLAAGTATLWWNRTHRAPGLRRRPE